ncbi:phospholipase A1 member A-like [Zophobas morio]|uniref:phospholipase A1 member A-like n=1 Tax=Zophobas morio TaxID=2755281 RepID=UPI003083BE95
MCALATLTGLALAATSVILLVFATTNGNLNKKEPPRTNQKKNLTNLSDTTDDNVQFILFTRQHPPHRIKINDMISLKKSGFNTSNPTKIIIHGFQSSIKEDVFVANKNAYMESGDYNVIGMDWSSLCEFEYLSAVGGARRAGKILAEFLNWLSGTGVALNELHLVGHSLGAHVAGIAGHQIKTGLIGRITGLDPAAPGFREVDPELKLDVKDAKLVDIIHTYIRVLSIAQPMGHIDFYPNGGRWQPGCPDIYDIWQVGESLVCNHARAYYFFAESIRNKHAFKSKRCNSVEEALYGRCHEETEVYMGQAETYKSGLYYIRTRAQPPYSLSNN